MNNKILFLLLAICITAISCSGGKKETFSIKGEIIGLENTWVKLARLDLSNNETIIVDSALSENGIFHFRGDLPTPYLHSIILGESEKIPLFLENTKMKLEGDIEDLENCTVTGSREDDLFRSYHMDDIFDRKKGMEIMLSKTNYTFSVFVAFYQFQVHNIHLDTMDLIVNSFQYPEKESIYFYYLTELYETIKNVSVSSTAPDFTMPDKNGKEISLSDFRGKYVLLDFWASWCPPCRASNPGLVEVFDKFGSRDFTIIGISVDHDRESWLRAIKDDGLEWTNLSNINGWNDISNLYGVKAIPQNFLLNKDGIILTKNIEKDLLIELLEEYIH